ncbi:hypothetical protein WZ342_2635 [Enterococcus faecalis]|nr:hypothetical protein WZ342_2635 [Enterococcus faecalis]
MRFQHIQFYQGFQTFFYDVRFQHIRYYQEFQRLFHGVRFQHIQFYQRFHQLYLLISINLLFLTLAVRDNICLLCFFQLSHRIPL